MSLVSSEYCLGMWVRSTQAVDARVRPGHVGKCCFLVATAAQRHENDENEGFKGF